MLPDEMPLLRRDPVVLRAFRHTDTAVVVAAGTDPLIPLITTVVAGGDEDDARAYIDRQQERLRTGAGYSFAIAEAASDVAVGQIGVWTSQLAETGRASVGYWIGPAHRRRGFAGAALIAATEWACGITDIEKLELYVEPWNTGSWRAAQAAGYQREGTLRAWQRVGDERRDMDSYSLIPDRSR